VKSIAHYSTLLLAPLLLLAAGCSRAHYKESADTEVYKILQQKQEKLFGKADPFTIERTTTDRVSKLPHGFQPLAGTEPPPEGKAPEGEPPSLLSLNEAVLLAIESSRDYQSNKESLYLTALSLTLERHQWRPILSGSMSGRYEKTGVDEAWAADSQFGISQIFATGGSLSVALGTNLLHFITGDPRDVALSALTATLSQPLWRGAGAMVAQENLVQAERNVVYQIRSFLRYHKTFLVSVASGYYQVLGLRAVVDNEWRNYQQLILARERTEAMAKAGRLAAFQVDQARQNELSARDGWVHAVQQYRQSLDSFKITLALPTDANVDVDASELSRLLERGVLHPEIAEDAAVRQALERRLDLVTARDEVDDACREVEVAANGLGADINLVATMNAPSDPTRPTYFRFNNAAYSAGLDVNLPLDRQAERNNYRAALINLDSQQRSTDLQTDQIKQQVRQDWRTLQEARESYEIQCKSVDLAQTRVDSTTMLLQAGRAETRDLLDSQSSLLQAQNARISALVNHTVARLELWRDMETLGVTDQGDLKEDNRVAANTPTP